MTDPATGSTPAIINTPTQEMRFAKLSPAEWVQLGNILRATRKAQRRAELAAAKTSEEETKRELDKFDRRPVKYWDVESFINSMDGQYEAIRIAVQRDKSGMSEAEIDAQISALGRPSGWLAIAGQLADLPIVSEEPDSPPPADAKGSNANPPGKTSTGDTSPT